MIPSIIRILCKYSDPIFVSFAVVSIIPVFVYHSEFNAPYVWAFRNLTIPIFVFCFSVGLIWKKDFLKGSKAPCRYWLSLFLLPPILVLLSGSIVLGLNANLPGQEIRTIEGIVTKHEITGGRYKSNTIEITNDEEKIRISVSMKDFLKVKLGDRVKKEVRYGPFGFAYTNKWKDANQAELTTPDAARPTS